MCIDASSGSNPGAIVHGSPSKVNRTFGRHLESVVAADVPPTRRWRKRGALDSVLQNPNLAGTPHHRLIRDHGVVVELHTPSVIVLLLGATSRIDVDRFLTALHALPEVPESLSDPEPLPPAAELRMNVREAFLAKSELVPWQEAIGQISADTLAAYPPGIPNVLPGESLTAETIAFLRATAAHSSGYVRGAADPLLDSVRVVRTDAR